MDHTHEKTAQRIKYNHDRLLIRLNKWKRVIGAFFFFFWQKVLKWWKSLCSPWSKCHNWCHRIFPVKHQTFTFKVFGDMNKKEKKKKKKIFGDICSFSLQTSELCYLQWGSGYYKHLICWLCFTWLQVIEELIEFSGNKCYRNRWFQFRRCFLTLKWIMYLWALHTGRYVVHTDQRLDQL